MDNKWPVIAARSGVKVGVVSAVAWALMDYASQSEDRGSVQGFDTEVYAVYSGFPETEVVAVIQAMTDKGVIVNGRLANWEKRQPKREDDSYDRVREHREKKRNVTQCNAETGQEKERDTDTEIDTEIEKDTEAEQKGAPDPFDLMQRLVESVTGYPQTQRDMQALRDFVKEGVIEEDVRAALEYLKSVGKTNIRGAEQLRGSVMTSRAKRIQGKGRKEQYVGPNGEVIEL